MIHISTDIIKITKCKVKNTSVLSQFGRLFVAFVPFWLGHIFMNFFFKIPTNHKI